MFDAYFYTFKKRKNSTKQVGAGGTLFQMTAKSDCNILNPKMIIKNFDIAFNYCYVPAFNRYYYITSYNRINAVETEVSMEVDTLATYRNDIKSTSAYVEYSNLGDAMIPDRRISMSNASSVYTYTNNLTHFDARDGQGTVVLSVVAENNNGKTGFITSYAMPYGSLATLAQRFNTANLIDDLKEQFLDPISAVAKCIWLPIDINAVSDGGASVQIGKYTTGIVAQYAKPTITVDDFLLSIPFQYQSTDPQNPNPYYDFRNAEPYSECTMFFPGVGEVKIPLIRFLGNGQSLAGTCLMSYTIDCITGDIVYVLSTTKENDIVLTLSGNIGVEYPVSGLTSNALQQAGNFATAVSSTVSAGAMFLTGNFMGGVAQAGTALKDSATMYLTPETVTTSISGNIGGRAAAPYSKNLKVQIKTAKLSSGFLTNTLGLPTYCVKNLGSISGYCKCNGASVVCSGTASEIEEINSYLNGGIYLE